MNRQVIVTLILFLALISGSVFGQTPNYMIFPSNRNQVEPTITRHPLNHQILFASAYTIYQNFLREGVYLSTNGGLNWFGSDTIPGVANQNTHSGDPGAIIDKNGIFIITHQNQIPSGMFSNYSTNGGTSWFSTASPIATGDQDKGAPGTDDAPASPYYGRTYLAWTRFTTPFPIVLAYTSNGAVNWSGIVQVNTSYNSNRSFGPYVSVSPSGVVYVVWASTQPASPQTEDCIGFAKSTNGGVNWQVSECAMDCNGIRTTALSPWNIRANSNPVMDVDKTGGARNGWIYVATTDKNIAPAGTSPDIVLHRSTDGGSTWSAGVRVNQDPINNGRNQFFPAIKVDEEGGVNIVYYDSRNAVDSVDVYLSRSIDGGFTFTDHKISTGRFRPVGITGTSGNMGDNIGMISGNGKLYPVWMSNQGNGVFQVWSANIDYNTIGIQQIGTEIPKQYSLSQNYPNPFNPVTKIKFQIAHSGAAKIIVYDALGKEITTLVDQQVKAGTYEASWDATACPSGVYFYRLITDGYSETRKMVMTK